MSGPPALETLGGARGDLSLFVRNARDLIRGPPVLTAPRYRLVRRTLPLTAPRSIATNPDRTGQPVASLFDHKSSGSGGDFSLDHVGNSPS